MMKNTAVRRVLPALPLILSHPDAAAPARGVQAVGIRCIPRTTRLNTWRRKKNGAGNAKSTTITPSILEIAGMNIAGIRAAVAVGMSMGMAAVADTIMNTAMNPGGN